MNRIKGTVTRVLLNKGFGFVRGTEDRLSRFMRACDVVPTSAFDTMHEGQSVTFISEGQLNNDPDAKNNGLRAVDVQIIDNGVL